MSLADLVQSVSNPHHLIAMWGTNPGSQDLFTLKKVGAAGDFMSDLLMAQSMFGKTPLPTTQLAVLVLAEPWRDGLMFGGERAIFYKLLESACAGRDLLQLSELAGSFTYRRQHLYRFYKSSEPGIDSLGIRMRRNSTLEFEAARCFHAISGPSTEFFGDVLGKVGRLKDVEAKDKRSAVHFKAVEKLLDRIKRTTLAAHMRTIAELVLALGEHLETESHMKLKGNLLELRWSFRFLMMMRCADMCPPIHIERWMYSAEVSGKPRASAEDELRVYAKL
jgi:hypothetical protein